MTSLIILAAICAIVGLGLIIIVMKSGDDQ